MKVYSCCTSRRCFQLIIDERFGVVRIEDQAGRFIIGTIDELLGLFELVRDYLGSQEHGTPCEGLPHNRGRHLGAHSEQRSDVHPEQQSMGS